MGQITMPPETTVHNMEGYEMVRAALLNPELAMGYEEFLHGSISERGILHLHGREHKDRRKAENSLFRREALAYYESDLMPRIIAQKLPQIVTSGTGDLQSIGHLLMLPLAADLVGVDFDDESEDEFLRLLRYSSQFAEGAMIWESSRDLEEVKADVRCALEEFDKRFFKRSRERRQRLIATKEAPSDLPADLLTALLLAPEELQLDDDLILRECAVFFEAATDTSTATLTNTMHYIFAWRDEHPEEWASRCGDMYFLQRCVQEALRVRPNSPVVLRRRAQKDLDIKGETIKAGDVVMCDIVSANHDRAVFGEDAGSFNPDRVLPNGIPPYGLSFSGGMHTCIGRTLAVGLPGRPPGVDPPSAESHLFGVVTVIVDALIRNGAIRNDRRSPIADPKWKTPLEWRRLKEYPILFRGPTDERA